MTGGSRKKEALNEVKTMAGEQVLDPWGADISHASPALPMWPAHWAPRGRAKGKPVGGAVHGEMHTLSSPSLLPGSCGRKDEKRGCEVSSL